MARIESFKSFVDYGANSTLLISDNLASKTSVVKKSLKITENIFKGIDYMSQQPYCPDCVKRIKGIVSLIGFYDLHRDLVYWIQPFNTKKMDQDILRKTLDDALDKIKFTSPTPDFALETINSLVNSKIHYMTKKDFLKDLKIALSSSMNPQQVDQVLEGIQIQMKSHSLVSIGFAYCETIFDLKGVLSMLEQFNLIDQARMAAQMGTKAPLFLFVTNAAVQVASKGMMILGVVTIVQSARQLIAAQKLIISDATADEKSEAYAARKKAIVEIAFSAVLLAQTTLPMAFVVGTPTLIILSTLSNSIGLVKIFAK